MQTLEAVFKIVTPLFMSGADQSHAELRPPSLKGVIRFWWRALAYSRFNGDLEALAGREEQLFGSTEKAANIIIRMPSHRKCVTTSVNHVHPGFRSAAGARYLGYGLMTAFGNEAGLLQRPCINHNQQLNVAFLSKDGIPEEFINAVKLTGLLGGLGSRSRKGFGSLTLDKLTLDKTNIWDKPGNDQAYKAALSVLLNDINNIADEPPFSAFSRLTRIDCLQTGNDPIQLLNSFGQQMQRYRSWGHHGRVNGKASEKNFEPDHDWYRRIGNYHNTDFHPRRVIFGLPHNYSQFAADNITGAEHDRRASPLLIHVHEYETGRYGLVSVVFRAQFLPDGERLNAGNRNVPQNVEWEIIDQFLDGFIGHRDSKTKTPYFPTKNTWFGG
ncbi:MAG: type III-B CRISPR module RAMP protein Cmr1 [Gammaproteobacteria bacterium]